MIRFILFFILFYVVFRLIRLFIVNFKLGSKRNDNIRNQNGSNKKQHSKYDNVEEADFTEIESKEENHKK